MAAEIIALALAGLVLGSFLSVVAHRVPLGESIVAPRSRCPNCKSQIAFYDNVPVVSWLVLGGRCRSCGERIPATYPLLEAGLAASFVGVLLRFEGEWELIALGCAFACTLFVITLTDLEHQIIPNKVLIAAAIVALGIAAPTDPDGLPERLIAAAAAFGFLLVVALAYPRGMGMGDVKLAGVMGLYLGKAVAPALLIGFGVGALYGVALIAARGSAARKQKVPFGPFLALGGIVSLFVGVEIVDWYVDTFFEE